MTQRSFRDVLGRFGTGVVLVTAESDGGPVGMAVNSFTSVSLDPPLIAFCAALTSTTWPAIRATGGFAITILSDTQEEVCRAFSVRDTDRFAGRDWARTPAGRPTVVDGLGWLDCRIRTVQVEGDHELVIAEAEDWSVGADARPLIFHSGRYASLEERLHAE
ncbi:flavin reductase family protein [Streptomyces sp. A3M-1-3]|uniref:flavin reductase family protein n=1 Tax=Streptomyces sp. A3M-1-3 TaxID=2962044 RepID=UPI0020B65F19|nr:flavin reductase family protein [Streptomyces sp. A3M-1-3]MCP3821471.1 flavin reductase family protein [Streptomyces sp. A3M-1-3]